MVFGTLTILGPLNTSLSCSLMIRGQIRILFFRRIDYHNFKIEV